MRERDDDEETKGDVNAEESKKMKELSKIRQNELLLAQLNKKVHQMKIDTALSHAQSEDPSPKKE